MKRRYDRITEVVEATVTTGIHEVIALRVMFPMVSQKYTYANFLKYPF